VANDPEVVKLVRRFEPILIFHPSEAFFPCDAKSYIEQCALWKAEQPFDEKDSWGGKGQPFDRKPLIRKMMIGVDTPDAIPTGGTYLGEKQGNAFPFLIDNAQEEHFLELGGWKDSPTITSTSENRYSNRVSVQLRYREVPLRDTRFWYHAELFHFERLQELIGGPSPALEPTPESDLLRRVFITLAPGKPALLCYYFLFPAHAEALAAPCDARAAGQEFASFAGEWACVAILLERGSPNDAHLPRFIGHTGRRDIGMRQGLDLTNNGRLGMTVKSWKVPIDVHAKTLPETVYDHPKVFVSLFTHSLYLQPGNNIVKPYPPEASPQWCGRYDSPNALEAANPRTARPASPLAWGKIVAGLLGGGLAGALAGTYWTVQEELPPFPYTRFGADVSEGDQPAPDIGPPSDNFGTVAHSEHLTLNRVEFPRATFVIWAARETSSVTIETETPHRYERHYNFIVNRSEQIWWPSDDGKSGYRGRWGPRVANDPFARRAGMRFPLFWRMFFVALAKMTL
jgi:hypothetical protein